jgi:hypothetical protein
MSSVEAQHLSAEALEAGLPKILESPKDSGAVMMIVCRPDVDQRGVLQAARLDTDKGLVGDNWLKRGSSSTSDGSADPEMQLNIMNSRVIDLVASSRDRWPLAGDQVFVDIDLSKDNLPAGTQLQLGDAIIEVTAPPHTGCKKFVARFGVEAMKFVNSRHGKKLCLRGINARVVKSGTFAVGDSVRKLNVRTS